MKKEIIPMAALEQRVIDMTTVQKVVIYVLTFSLLCVGFYYLKYKPQADKIQSLETDIKAQEMKLAELKRAAEQVQVLEAEIAKLEEEFGKLVALLPDQREIPGLLASVSKLAAQSGLEQVSFQPQPEQMHEFYAIIPVRLELIGSYHELGVFLDKVSKLDRIVKVDNLGLTRSKEPPKLQVGCNVLTYRFVEKAPAKPEQKKK
jgi:type IV pilus assembly protein PilO